MPLVLSTAAPVEILGLAALQLRLNGLITKHLAAQLTREGHRTPRSQRGYTSTSVRKHLSRRGLTGAVIGREKFDRGEWWIPDLARELGIPSSPLRDWAMCKEIRARRVIPEGPSVIWAGGRERRLLRNLVDDSE
jgi:hypothetical protein